MGSEPTWDTLDRITGGEEPPAVWLGPREVLRAVADQTPDRYALDQAIVETQVVAIARAGSAAMTACQSVSTPLTCLAEEAEILTIPDPTSSVIGAAVVVAVAREADATSGELSTEELAQAVDVLGDARLDPTPARQLLGLGVPDGEVAIDDDTALLDRRFEDRIDRIDARWPRVATGITIGALRDLRADQAERSGLLLRDSGISYGLTQSGAVEIGSPIYVDDGHPAEQRPTVVAPVTAAELQAARQAWIAGAG